MVKGEHILVQDEEVTFLFWKFGVASQRLLLTSSMLFNWKVIKKEKKPISLIIICSVQCKTKIATEG